MKRSLDGLTDVLFKALESIQNADDDHIEDEIKRAKATTEISRTLLEAARVGLESVKVNNEYYGRDIPMPALVAGKTEER